MPVSFRYAARTDLGLGSKARNEDSAYAGPELLVLCDGMGGHAAGDVASSLVVGELVHLDGESHGADDALDILETAVDDANNRLADVMEVYPDSDGMGTTCIAMMRIGSKLAVANIGDSRAYLLRDGRLTRITKDHSFVQKLLDEGRISPDEALHHPQRSLVTRVLTGRPEDAPDLSMRELRRGDRLLICSDGLTDYVAEDTVREILGRTESTPGQVADELVRIALRASTRDNVTVIVADVVDSGEGTTKPQVVGAASRRRGTRMLTPQTPAEKAAQLSREAAGIPATEPEAPILAEEESAGPIARWLRRLAVAATVLALLGGLGWGAYRWSQDQYFVGEQDGRVTVFRGVAADLGPLDLSEVDESTDLAVDDLPDYYQAQVRRTLSADDRADAEAIVTELRSLSTTRCRPQVVDEDGATLTAVPEGAVVVDRTRPTTDGSAATASPSGPGRGLDAGSGLGEPPTPTDEESTSPSDARPTVELVLPEGCR